MGTQYIEDGDIVGLFLSRAEYDALLDSHPEGMEIVMPTLDTEWQLGGVLIEDVWDDDDLAELLEEAELKSLDDLITLREEDLEWFVEDGDDSNASDVRDELSGLYAERERRCA